MPVHGAPEVASALPATVPAVCVPWYSEATSSPNWMAVLFEPGQYAMILRCVG
jgi:hypothetical protein